MLGHAPLSAAPLSAQADAGLIVQPASIASAESFGAPTSMPGSVTVGAIGIAVATAVGNPSVLPDSVTVQAQPIASAENFGTPLFQSCLTTLFADSIASAEAVGNPAVLPGSVTVGTGGIPSATAFGVAKFTLAVGAVGLPSAETFGQPSVAGGPITVQFPGAASLEAFGAPVFLGEAQILYPEGTESAETFGTPHLWVPGALIAGFDLEHVQDRRVRLTWYGTTGKVAWIVLNGQMAAGPLDFDAPFPRICELSIPELFAIEVHESDPDERIEPIGYPLQRRPVIHWTHVNGASRYHVYRRRNASAPEERIAVVPHIEDPHYFEHQTARDQRANGGVWNFYRVAAVDSAGRESQGEAFPHFVPGLPAPPKNVKVEGPPNALVLTIEI